MPTTKAALEQQRSLHFVEHLLRRFEHGGSVLRREDDPGLDLLVDPRLDAVLAGREAGPRVVFADRPVHEVAKHIASQREIPSISLAEPGLSNGVAFGERLGRRVRRPERGAHTILHRHDTDVADLEHLVLLEVQAIKPDLRLLPDANGSHVQDFKLLASTEPVGSLGEQNIPAAIKWSS